MDKLFYFKDRDGHYIIGLLGLVQISIKHKSNYKYKPALSYGVTTEKRNPQLIVSLTSFPKRINYVVYTINTLLQQTLKPDRIVLWLADSQFPNKEDELPAELLKLRDFGLEIKWCEDLRSYKKLIPSLKEFPNDIIVTCDDDLYYEENWLEKLYNAYLKNPEYIHIHRTCRMIYNDGVITRYSQRKAIMLHFPEPSYFNSVFGAGGCLYPPHTLSDEVFNVANIDKTVGFHDDFWFWGMAVLKGTKICEVDGPKSNFKIIDGTVESSLYKEHSNDDIIGKYYKLFEAYPLIKERLEEEKLKEKSIIKK